MNKIDLQLFDIIAYLEDQGVNIYEEGKNISEGWIGIECVFPDCDDTSNHLGINLHSKLFKCWKCHKSGPVTLLIKEIEQISYGEACDRLKEYQDPYFLNRKEERKLKVSGSPLCKEASKDFHQLALEYIKSRRFDPEIIIPKYDLYCTYNMGKYKFRIIIPVITEGVIVGFTGRDYTGKNETRYKKCKFEESLTDHKEWWYNIDTVKSKVLIVEGPTDVWRMGDGCISPLTSEFSHKQIDILASKELKEAYILFDTEKHAQRQANKMAYILSSLIPHVEILELPEGDPASLEESTANKLISEIFDDIAE